MVARQAHARAMITSLLGLSRLRSSLCHLRLGTDSMLIRAWVILSLFPKNEDDDSASRMFKERTASARCLRKPVRMQSRPTSRASAWGRRTDDASLAGPRCSPLACASCSSPC